MVIRPTMKQALLAAGCIAGAVVWVGTQSTGADFFPRRRLDMSYHLSVMQERNTIPGSTYDTTSTQYMSSPCRPEYDGYFGSTSGTPFEIQYGFEMETEDEDNVEFLLEEIHEQIVDTVLSVSFPNLCGFRRRQARERHLSVRGLSTRESQLKAKPRFTGFKFGTDLKQRQDICAPQADATNLCGVYKNSISIFGRHLGEIGENLLAQVKEALEGEQQRLAGDGLVRLKVDDGLTAQTGDYTSQPTGLDALSYGAKAAILFLIIAALAGAATFAVYVYLERKKLQRERPYLSRGKQQGSNRTLGCDEASQVSEKVGLRGGTAVVLENGRPVVIEFDKKGSRRERDAIEDERSECGSTVYSHQYVPSVLLRDVNEECKEPEPRQPLNGAISSNRVLPADPMGHSVASMSEYAEESARSEQIHMGTFT